MTQAERLTLDSLNGHIMEMKEDVGALKADVAAIKEALADGKDQRRHWNVIGTSVMSALLGAASLVGLERWLGR